jgi:hypothetical protein
VHPPKTKEESILLWSANVKTEANTPIKSMSEASYLVSYGFFLESILSHPKFAEEKESKYDIVRLFKVGDVTIKFQVQPIIVFDLLLEGPVVMTKREKPAPAKEDDKKLNETRLEVQGFYACVKNQISRLEHIFVARDVDEKGKTIRPSPALVRQLSSASGTLTDEEGSDVGDSSQDSQLDRLDKGAYSSNEPLSLLSKLKKSFRRQEFELYDLLKTVQRE